MGTWTENFDASALDEWWQASYWTPPATDGTLTWAYISNLDTTMYLRRTAGLGARMMRSDKNISVEYKVKFAAWPEVQMSFISLGLDADESSLYWSADKISMLIYYITGQGWKIRIDNSYGTGFNDTVWKTPGNLSNSIYYWFKLEQNADRTFSLHIKEDGGSYALFGTTGGIWPFAELEYPGCWLRMVYDHGSTSAADVDMRFDQIVCTADQMFDDESWPKEVVCNFHQPGFDSCMGSDLVPTGIVEETFDVEPDWVTDWYKGGGAEWVTANGLITFTWPIDGGDNSGDLICDRKAGYIPKTFSHHSAAWRIFIDFAPGVSVEVGHSWNPSSVYNSKHAYMNISFLGDEDTGPTGGQVVCRAQSDTSGLSYEVVNPNLLHATWYWFRIYAELDVAYFQYKLGDTGAWITMATAPYDDDRPREVYPYLYVDIYGWEYAYRNNVLKVDKYVVDTFAHDSNNNTIAMSDEWQPGNFMARWGSGWENVFQWTSQGEEAHQTDPDVYDTLDYRYLDAPFLESPPNSLNIFNHYWTTGDEQKFSMAGAGNLFIHLNVYDIDEPVAPWFWGIEFKINGILCRIGGMSNASNLHRHGFRIDGVYYEHSDTTPNFDSTSKYTVQLTGTHMVVTAVDASSGSQIIFEDTNFLGGPAKYTADSFRLMFEGTFKQDWLYCRSIIIYNQFVSPPPRYGDLVLPFTYAADNRARITAESGFDQVYFFYKSGVTGGTSDDLDGLNPSNLEGTGQTLKTGSVCLIVTDTDDVDLYVAEEDPTAVESIPDVILPDLNPGNWAWKKSDAFHPAQLTKVDLSASAQAINRSSPAFFLTTFWNDAISDELDDVIIHLNPLGVSAGDGKTGELSIICVPTQLVKDNNL